MKSEKLALDIDSLLGFRLLDRNEADGSVRLGSKISTKPGLKPDAVRNYIGSKIGAKDGLKPDSEAR